jgi:ABC-type oligopeptide transport system substrate-binding subunit
MQRLTRHRWLLALFALSVLLAACGTEEGETTTTAPAASTTGAPGETTTAAPVEAAGTFSTYIVEPEHLSPLTSNESEGIAVLRAIFAGLTTYDYRTADTRLQVAEAIETTDGGKNWTVVLKPGWTFHNGEPVTASSFVDAWNYGAYGPNGQQNNSFYANIAGYADLNPAEGATPTAETLAGLKVVDDLNFTIELEAADPQFLIKLGYAAFYPLPAVYFEDPVAFEEAPVGNGPFMVDGVWEHDVQVVTVAYPGYAGDDKPKAGGITFRIYADENTAYNDLLAGELDVMDSLPTEQIEAARTEFGERFGETPDTSINQLFFPMYLPEFGENKELRQALSMAIDREAITQAIFNNNRDPAVQWIPLTFPGGREFVCDNWTYDPEAAKAKFDAAGGWSGPMTIWFNSGAGHDEWIEAVANMWRETLGIEEIVFEQLEFAEYLPLRDEQGMTGPYRTGWGMDYPSPENFLAPLFATASQPPAGSNDSFFSNADFDKALDDAAAATAAEGLDAAIPLYQQAEDILCEEVPVIPVFWRKNLFAWSERVSGVYVDLFGDINYTEIEVVG